MKNNLIGVIGAGVMGQGVAQSFAEKGYKVILLDTNDELLKKAIVSIEKNIKLNIFFNKQSLSIKPNEVIENITLAKDYSHFKDVDFIIENVTENWEIKKDVYESLNNIQKGSCITLVNTSCISITKIGAVTKDSSKVIGVHFMNPVPLKTTVEVIKGYHTSDGTVQKVKALLGDIGKECIVVNDYPGFVSNRISHLFMNEAAFVVQDQVASPKEVDDIFKKCYSHKMGPLETADLIGLDTVVNSLNVLYESYQDPKFRCCPLLKKMVEAGFTGRKSGKGFYNY